MTYTITNYTRNRASQLGVTVKASTSKGKKIDVFNKDGKKIASIGALGYGDFPTFTKLKGLKFAKERQKAYRARHAKNIAIKGSNGYYAGNLLW
tara:strand:- start:933 stop:1214 length:282 start_codon:yes stop_codon:yes gene_type:complete